LLITAVGILDGTSLRNDGAALGCELKDDGTTDATKVGSTLGYEESAADGVVVTCIDGVSVITSDGITLGLLLTGSEGLTDGDSLTVEGKVLGNMLGITLMYVEGFDEGLTVSEHMRNQLCRHLSKDFYTSRFITYLHL